VIFWFLVYGQSPQFLDQFVLIKRKDRSFCFGREMYFATSTVSSDNVVVSVIHSLRSGASTTTPSGRTHRSDMCLGLTTRWRVFPQSIRIPILRIARAVGLLTLVSSSAIPKETTVRSPMPTMDMSEIEINRDKAAKLSAAIELETISRRGRVSP